MMLIRIVKMTFREDAIGTFRQIFEDGKHTIRAFNGCHHVELWQDDQQPCTFFTYSHWTNQEALDNYRNSPFFATTWRQTKLLFAAPAQAWSVHRASVAG